MCLGFTFLMWILNVCDSNECDIFFDHSIPLQSRLQLMGYWLTGSQFILTRGPHGHSPSLVFLAWQAAFPLVTYFQAFFYTLAGSLSSFKAFFPWEKIVLADSNFVITPPPVNDEELGLHFKSRIRYQSFVKEPSPTKKTWGEKRPGLGKKEGEWATSRKGKDRKSNRTRQKNEEI